MKWRMWLEHVYKFLNEKQVSNESSTSEAHSDTRYASGRAETDNMKSQMAEARVNTRRNERMKGAAGTSAMPWNTENTVTPISHSRQKAAADVTLYASNGLNGQQGHISPVAMSPNMMMGNAYGNMEYYSAAKSSGPVYLSDYEERREYHQPVKYFGSSFYYIDMTIGNGVKASWKNCWTHLSAPAFLYSKI